MILFWQLVTSFRDAIEQWLLMQKYAEIFQGEGSVVAIQRDVLQVVT
jgi:hypothetical protein